MCIAIGTHRFNCTHTVHGHAPPPSAPAPANADAPAPLPAAEAAEEEVIGINKKTGPAPSKCLCCRGAHKKCELPNEGEDGDGSDRRCGMYVPVRDGGVKCV